MDGARIPRTEVDGLFGFVVKRVAVRMVGRVPDSLGVLWHHQPVLRAMMGVQRKAAGWDECAQQLKSFAHLAVASAVGCSFCLDFGYFQAHDAGLDLTKAQQVPCWRESTVFTPLERDVLEYAEAMTATPPTVTDALSARLLEQLGAAGLVELSAFIGIANLAARSNVALGIAGEGYAASCGLAPMAQRSGVPAA